MFHPMRQKRGALAAGLLCGLVILASVPPPVDAARTKGNTRTAVHQGGGGGGGAQRANAGGGGGAQRANVSANSSGQRTAAAGTQRDLRVDNDANVNRNRTVNQNTNVNRNTNVNQNTNVNRNIDIDADDIDIDDGDWDLGDNSDNPLAAAAAVTAVVGVTAAAIGSVVYEAPPSCSTVVVDGFSYMNCSGTWYQPQYEGTQVSYIVVNPPQ